MRGAPTRLRMGPGVFQDLAEAGKDWTEGKERCGILFGAVDEDGCAWAAGSAELLNASRDPWHAYEFEPLTQARAWARIEGWGYEVLGIWHTHPAGPEGPSGTDLAYAQPWFLYPVLWPNIEGVGFGVYALADDEAGYREVPYDVAPGMGEHAQAVAKYNAMRAEQARREG